MEFKELIQERRSCRSYEEGTIEKSEIEDVLREAEMCPSWCNFECSRSYVAYSPEMMQKVFAALPEYNRNNAKNACALVVSTFVKGFSGFIDGKQTDKLGDGWGAYDLGLHDAYLVLSFKDHGYDTLIMGLRDAEKLKEVFGIPENEVIMSVIAVGKHEGKISPRPRKDLTEVSKIR